MTLKERFDQDLAAAIKSRDQLKMSVLRMIKAAIKNKEVEKRGPLDDAQVLQVLSSLIKQRRDSIEQFAKGGRQDLVDKEAEEIKIIQSYMPESLTEEQVERIIEAAIGELGATSAKDFGAVMKSVMAKVAGRADGRLVSELVKRKLSG